MRKIMFIMPLMLACALRSTAAGAATAADTTQVYVVDGEKQARFSGAELVGKTVRAYRIAYASRDGRTYAIHLISTTAGKASAAKEKVVYMLNGKEVTQRELDRLSSDALDHMEVVRAGSEAAVGKFGERGLDHTFVLVETKK